jgi:peptidoglycan-associated lipoprotein
MNSKFFKRALLALLVSGMLSACSTTGKGGKDGDGTGEGGLSEQDLNAQRDSRFGSGSIPEAEGEGVLRDVMFDYDSSAISDQARQDIEYNYQVLQANPDVKVQLEGHCDDRGTAEYNMALGQERARAVKEVLLSYGVPENKLNTISYGEEVPLAQGSDESAWAKNRRVHFSAYRDMPQQ